MGKKTYCDGTGAEIPEESPVTGHFGKQYSEEARAIAEAYLRELDEAHTKCAKAFADALAEIRARYHERLQVLPDE